MIKKYFAAAIAAIALVACAPEYDTDNLPVEPQWPTMEGSGNLKLADGTATAHTYEFKITADLIDIKAVVKQGDDVDWAVGGFPLESKAIQAALGVVNFSDISVFYPLSNGNAGTWTSYEPGQWVMDNGEATNWSSGKVYWFYNVVTTSEDYSKDDFVIGINTSNVKVGETITSKSMIKGVPFNVTISYVK